MRRFVWIGGSRFAVGSNLVTRPGGSVATDPAGHNATDAELTNVCAIRLQPRRRGASRRDAAAHVSGANVTQRLCVELTIVVFQFNRLPNTIEHYYELKPIVCHTILPYHYLIGATGP